MKKTMLKKVISVIMAMVLLSSVVLIISAEGTLHEALGQSPYVEAYLDEITLYNRSLSTDQAKVSEEVIASLNSYYAKDCELSEFLSEYVSAEVDLSSVTSLEKADKIAAMHMMENVYSIVVNQRCRYLISDYFRRYANDSGDAQAIDFYNSVFAPEKTRRTLVAQASEGEILTKAELERVLAMENSKVRSTASYDDNFAPAVAGQWAYNNYAQYNADFPAFTNGYGSDCANFVSQALYFGGMEMHDTWYCHKKNDEYPTPANATQLNYSWSLADPSPWCSVEEFVSFWGNKYKDYYEYTKDEYTANHTSIFSEPIGRGDVIILCADTLWWSTPEHAMIISAWDVEGSDFLCAGHSNVRQAYPLLNAIANYGSVRIYCL